MKYLLPLLFLGLLAMTLIPQAEGAPMDDIMRSKRSPQDAAEETEATTPVWCNPSNPFRLVKCLICEVILFLAPQVSGQS